MQSFMVFIWITQQFLAFVLKFGAPKFGAFLSLLSEILFLIVFCFLDFYNILYISLWTKI